MKHLLTLTLALFSTSLAMATGEAKDTITVTNAAEFISAIKNNNDINIKLDDDIQLNLTQQICHTFTGSINGYFQVYNKATGEMEERVHAIYADIDHPTRSVNIEMFNTVDGAEIRDVLFTNYFVDTNNHNNTGLIAREAKNSTFFNVTFDRVKVACNNDNVGIIAGRAEKCNFGVVTTKYCEVYADGIQAGGLVGTSDHCKYEFCINNPTSRVFADGRFISGGAYAGGFCGYSSYDTFTSCINSAMVGSDEDNVGGYTGKSKYSDFISCENSGYIVHSSFDLFRESANHAQAKIESISDTELGATIKGLIGMGITLGGTVIATSLISPIATSIVKHSYDLYMAKQIGTSPWYLKCMFALKASKFTNANLALGLQNSPQVYEELFLVRGGYMKGASVAGYCSVVMKPLAILMAIEVAANIAINLYSGDDETGGFSAQAQGGTFTLCSNLGNLRCKDDNCGGIVGVGFGVTINNCFNSGSAQWDEDDTTGSILGKSNVDSDKGNKQCLVTNCLSTWAFHIVGDESIESGLDPASGNNYRLQGGKGDPVFCEMQVNQDQLKSGLVAMWLNQGIQNRINDEKPWRQTLVAEVDSLADNNPVLTNSHAIVTIQDLAHDTITTADQLMAFAQKVNSGNQFACAVLDADIDMAGQPWIPIGKDEVRFRGIFDGRGHTISGLKCNSEKSVGLFGTVHTGAEISNVIIGEDCELTTTGNYHEGVAGIVGKVSIGWHWGNVVIENCANLGKLNAPATANAGGILGLVDNNIADAVKVFVNNCLNLGTITADNRNGALLCGYMRNSGVVRNSWGGGKLLSTTEMKPFDDTQNGRPEYFVGYMDNLDIQNCYAIDPLNNVQGLKDETQTEQKGVAAKPSEVMTCGELAYELNKGVVDGTQMWYQTIGTDAQPVRTKLPDGTNMVYSYLSDEGTIAGYANTSSQEIADVITGKEAYNDHRVVDIDQTGQVAVSDLVSFIAAAIR